MSQTAPSPASRAGLILVPTVDKNGRKTRVWKRAGDLSTSQLARIITTPSTVASNRLYAVGFDPKSIKSSPWGKVSSVEETIPGVYVVTAENGKGVYLSPARQEEVDERWSLGQDGFYSSDGVAWAVIPFSFPDEFSPEAVDQATDYLKDYRPHEYMDITSDTIDVDDSEVLSAEAFDAQHVGEYAVNSMVDGVVDGEVIVTAGKIGEDGEEAQFVVSDKELENDGELPKGHRKLIDEERHPRTNEHIEQLKSELLGALKVAMISRFPRSRYLLSTFAVTKAAIKGANKFREPEDSDEYIGKNWGLDGMMAGFLSQLIIEVSESKNYPRDMDAEQARIIRRQERGRRARNWFARRLG